MRRQRRKIFVGFVFVGGILVFVRYMDRKLRELQEKEVRELLERNQRQQHFVCIERTCNGTMTLLASGWRESVTKTINTEAILEDLRSGSTNKVESWNLLKVLVITRSAVIIYSHVMLVVLLRIQLNLIGGYMFKDSQANGNAKFDNETQQKYLSLCGYFMEEGVSQLSLSIRESVEKVTEQMSLKDKLTLRDLEQMYWSIASMAMSDSSKDPIKNMARYMLPPDCEKQASPDLSKVIMETVDLLESEEVQSLTQSFVRSGFALMLDHVSERFVNDSTGQVSSANSSRSQDPAWTSSVEKSLPDNCRANGYMNINNMTMPLAKIIPLIHAQVRDIPNSNDVPSSLLQRLVTNDKLKALGANIYEAFSF